jgi:hypothetical protein
MKIRAPHKGEFSLDVIEQPIALFQTLDGNFFHLRDCVEVQLEINTPPAVLAQGQDILNRALLLLPARIREGFCDGPLGKIECIGKTERHKVAGQTSKISDPFVKKRFHFAWDINRVPYCFHRQFLPCLIDFVKKSIQPATLPEQLSGYRRIEPPLLSLAVEVLGIELANIQSMTGFGADGTRQTRNWPEVESSDNRQGAFTALADGSWFLNSLRVHLPQSG